MKTFSLFVAVVSICLSSVHADEKKAVVNRKPQSVDDCGKLANRIGHTEGARALVERVQKMSKKKQLCLVSFLKSREQDLKDAQDLAECYADEKTSYETIQQYARGYSEGVADQQKQIETPCSVLKK